MIKWELDVQIYYLWLEIQFRLYYQLKSNEYTISREYMSLMAKILCVMSTLIILDLKNHHLIDSPDYSIIDRFTDQLLNEIKERTCKDHQINFDGVDWRQNFKNALFTCAVHTLQGPLLNFEKMNLYCTQQSHLVNRIAYLLTTTTLEKEDVYANQNALNEFINTNKIRKTKKMWQRLTNNMFYRQLRKKLDTNLSKDDKNQSLDTLMNVD